MCIRDRCTAVETCPAACPAGTGNLSAGVEIPLGPQTQRPGAGIKEYQARAVAASKVLLSVGNPAKQGDPFVETGDTLHTTLLYLCCLKPAQLHAILALLDSPKHP